MADDVPPPKKPNLTNGGTPAPDTPEQEGSSSKFIPESTETMIKKQLGITAALDPHLQEMLKEAKAQKSRDGKSLTVDLGDGHKFLLTKGGISGGDGDPEKPVPVTEKSAEVMISLAKARGWDKINVNGNTDADKDLLWIEAQRQGLKVDNYKPDPESAIAKTWKDEQEHGRKPHANVSQAVDDAFHLKTMQMLKEKVDVAQDKDVKAALEGMLKKFTDGHTHGDEKTLKALSEALATKDPRTMSDKDPRACFNAAVDILNRADPSLAIAKLEDTPPPAAGQRQPPAKNPNNRALA